MATSFPSLDGLYLYPPLLIFPLFSETLIHKIKGIVSRFRGLSRTMSDTPPILKHQCRRWIKAWVTQDLVGTGKTCEILKWVREDMLKVLKEKSTEPEPEEPKPEPTTEILFLCTYEGCNKAFATEGSYKKHSYTHGERQHACSFPGCEKKFKDSSKLKRHQIVHTGQKDFICPYEGCGSAFGLKCNMKSHMKTHLAEYYYVCPYPDCGKRFTQECKLKSHFSTRHGKTSSVDMMVKMPRADKIHSTVKATAVIRSCPSSDRRHVCPYEGCGKAYIYKYKLNLHLDNKHPDRNPEGSNRCSHVDDDTMDEDSNQDVYIAKGGVAKNYKRSKPNLPPQMPSAKLAHQKGSPLAHPNTNTVMQQNSSHESYEVDSEETEDEVENIAESRRYQEVSDGGDDEDTEDEE